jgi:hypothetical protein
VTLPRALVLASGIAVAATFAHATYAQPRSEDQAAAEDLFQRGKARMADKDYVHACGLFAESYRIDAAGGTLQNLAVCYEELGLWASAYARFEELRALSKTGSPPRLDRVQLADEHIAVLVPKLSRVVIVADAQPPGLVVRIDGAVRAPIAWPDGIVIDPGAHVVEAEAPGKRPFTAHVDVGASAVGRRQTVHIPALADAPVAKRPGPPEPHPTRAVGAVVGGVGIAALSVGAVFGWLAFDASSEGKDLCRRSTNPGALATDFDAAGTCYTGSGAFTAANSKIDDARTDATFANVLVPVGAVALAVGVYLFFRHGSAHEASAAYVMPSRGGAAFEARF